MKPNERNLSVRIPAAMYAAIEERASEQTRSLTHYVMHLIKQDIANHSQHIQDSTKKPNPAQGAGETSVHTAERYSTPHKTDRCRP
jgi:hypothetical protein